MTFKCYYNNIKINRWEKQREKLNLDTVYSNSSAHPAPALECPTTSKLTMSSDSTDPIMILPVTQLTDLMIFIVSIQSNAPVL